MAVGEALGQIDVVGDDVLHGVDMAIDADGLGRNAAGAG
jgi:hypothetical protein